MAYLAGEACLAPTIAPRARIRNATLFFALKVQYNLAQGSALGYDTTKVMRPERATHYANNTYRRPLAGFYYGTPQVEIKHNEYFKTRESLFSVH